MAESSSSRGNSGDFAKKVQRQLSRGKEKVTGGKKLVYVTEQQNKLDSYVDVTLCAGAAKARKNRGNPR